MKIEAAEIISADAAIMMRIRSAESAADSTLGRVPCCMHLCAVGLHHRIFYKLNSDVYRLFNSLKALSRS